MAIRSGALKHLITIESVARSKDEGGNETETWTPVEGFARIFGEVLPDRAGEFFAARQVQATANAMIRLYYQPGIAPNMRVVHHMRPGLDQYWDIQGVVPFQSDETELRLMCLWRDTEGWRKGTDLGNGA